MTGIQLDSIRYDSQGLVPAIVQDAISKDVLMLAYMNKESLEKTVATGTTWFWSRSRQELWNKGRLRGTRSAWFHSAMTAMRTRFWCWRSRPDPLATPDPTPASAVKSRWPAQIPLKPENLQP